MSKIDILGGLAFALFWAGVTICVLVDELSCPF